MSFLETNDLQTPKKDVNQLFQHMGEKLGWFEYKDLDTAARSLSLSSKKKATSCKIKRTPKNRSGRSAQENSCNESDTNLSGFAPKPTDAMGNSKQRPITYTSSVTKPKPKKGSASKSIKKVKKKLHSQSAEFSSDDDSSGIPARASKACTDLTRETSRDNKEIDAEYDISGNIRNLPSYGHAGSGSSPDSVFSDHEVRYCESTRIFSRKSAIFEGLIDLSPVEDPNENEGSFIYLDAKTTTENYEKCNRDIDDDKDISLMLNAMQLKNVSVRKRRTAPKPDVNETVDEFYTVCEGNSSSRSNECSSSGSNECYKTVLGELPGLSSNVVHKENDDQPFDTNTPSTKNVSCSYITEHSSYEVMDVSVQTDQNVFDSHVLCGNLESPNQTDPSRKKWTKLSLKSQAKQKLNISEVSTDRSLVNSSVAEASERMSDDSASSFEVQDVSIQTDNAWHHELNEMSSSKGSSVESLPELPGVVDDILTRLHSIGDNYKNNLCNSDDNNETIDYEVQSDSIKDICISRNDDITEFCSTENNQSSSDRKISDICVDKTVYYEATDRLSIFDTFQNTVGSNKHSATNGIDVEFDVDSIEEPSPDMSDKAYLSLSSDGGVSGDSLPDISPNKSEDIERTFSVESLPDILDGEMAHIKSRLLCDQKITMSVESLPDVDVFDKAANIFQKKVIMDNEMGDSLESLPDLNHFRKPDQFEQEIKYTASYHSDSGESLLDIDIDSKDIETKHWRTPLRSRPPFVDSSDDDDDDMEAFYERMKTPAKKEPSASPDMKAFIVDDSDSSCDPDDNVFYVNTDRINTPVSSVKKIGVSRVKQSFSSDDEEEYMFKTPKFIRPNQKKELKPLTNHNVFSSSNNDQQMTFLKSLCSTVSNSLRTSESSRCVLQFKKHREGLTKKLFLLFNDTVFEDKLPHSLPIIWNNRLVKTAGYCKYKRDKMAPSERSAVIELSTKVCDSAERTRDTLIHELCHAAVWLLNGLKEGHGPYWKHWVRKANVRHPELPIISRCHAYSISTKYTYQCLQCGYRVGRHSKSLNTVKKVCGYCRGTFILQATPSAKGSQTPRTPNKFALFVKENYGLVKSQDASVKHAGIMNILSSEFAKTKISNS